MTGRNVSGALAFALAMSRGAFGGTVLGASLIAFAVSISISIAVLCENG
ncbi:hypothetical protein SJ05684_b42470 (plasmid) [Sinorhizobium sojae CCBAU 05684]|uniref:Uncharacterized protein n=1 Tax=Sinorhizobium sojae CCBAU 05684 TaxID=716928 RepID=A0A249PIS3_9HYPH|nr:hypothetical protein SJ05684_b42470 [Sinorhizobium sojae CCBAU 05684]